MRKIRIYALLTALALAFAMLAGCSAAAPKMNSAIQEAPAADMAMPSTAPAPAAPAPEGGAGYGYEAEMQMDEAESAPLTGSAVNPLQERKIIYNANLSLITRQFDQTLAYIENKITALGGSIANSSLQGKKPEEWNDSGRFAQITARIPAAYSEQFLRDVQGEAEVVSLNRYSDDVTAQFIDTESRVSVLKTQLERLQAILVTRDRLSDVLELESEIARITLEIEQLTTNLRRWDNLVQFATVTIELSEITEMTAPKPISTDLGSRIREGFYSSITGVGRFLGDLVVFLIAALPVLVLLGVIGVAIWLIVRRGIKRSADKQQKRSAMSAGYYKAYMERFGMPPPPGSMPPEVSDESADKAPDASK